MSPQELRRRAENMRRYAILDGMDHKTRLECLSEASKMEERAQEMEKRDDASHTDGI